MIKGLGFGKLSKLLCSSLLISCFILLGSSVNSYKIQQVGLDSSPSIIDSNYNITFLKGGGLLTNYIGYGKNVLALDGGTFFWWAPNGLPYLYYGPYANFQGFFNTFEVCSPITGLDSLPSNCSSSTLNSDSIPLLRNFFNSVVAGDYVYYNYTAGSDSSARWGQSIQICFSSVSIGNSFCFSEACNYNYADTCGSHLSNSQNYSNLTFSSIPSNSIGPAPGQAGYNGEFNGSSDGSIQGSVDGSITGDFVYSTCTVGYAKANYEKRGLNTGSCFAGIGLDSTGVSLPELGQGASVFDLYNATNNGQNFCSWFQYWAGNYTNRYVINPSIFLSQPSALYSYFNIINSYYPEYFDGCTDIQNYCKIILNNMDLDSTWNGSASVCPIVNGPYIGEGGRDPVNQTGVVWDGKTPIGVNWNGVGGSSSVVDQKDALNFIQDFFNKAKSVIPTDYSDYHVPGAGFLPTYIITFLLAIILFRFLSH